MSDQKIIYDFGSNNGDDIPYYLQKSDIVVAVEANPVLVEQIKSRFAQEILDRRLVVEHCILSVDEDGGASSFYVHKRDHVLSQFPRPDEASIVDFDEISVALRNVISIIKQYGPPLYIKIDLESYDKVVLAELFRNNIHPRYLSAESHSIDIFSLLVVSGHYLSFNLVDGASVRSEYADHRIVTSDGSKSYNFPYHSAGPFGEDIKGPWMTPNDFFRRLAIEGLGWKDIHATNEIAPELMAPAYSMRGLRGELIRTLKNSVRDNAPGVFRALKTMSGR